MAAPPASSLAHGILQFRRGAVDDAHIGSPSFEWIHGGPLSQARRIGQFHYRIVGQLNRVSQLSLRDNRDTGQLNAAAPKVRYMSFFIVCLLMFT